MSHLIDIATKDPAAVSHMAVEQIVAICGDGKLRDNSPCSEQFRRFLAHQKTEKLAEYARYCLESKFERSGFVLQDVVNEIGRRLAYSVTNGRYSGVTNDIGFDGLWSDGKHQLVAEVKTTDAYRINLDVICAYGSKLQKDADTVPPYTLIVVGRQDTGDLEAQIRGSRHAWSVRLISIDALIKLMFVNEELDDPTLTGKIRQVLLPFEYTRVDHIVDLVFETQQETEIKTQGSAEAEAEEATDSPEEWSQQNTPKADLERVRAAAIDALFKSKNSVAKRVSKTNFEDASTGLHVTCAVSKLYKRINQPYWYALHPNWVEFMKGGKESFFVLACMDRNEAYAIPFAQVLAVLKDLNKTETPQRSYWHVGLSLDQSKLVWNISRVGKKIDLSPFAYRIAYPS